MSGSCRRTPTWRRRRAPPSRIAWSRRPPAPDRRIRPRRRQAPARGVAREPRMSPSAVPASPAVVSSSNGRSRSMRADRYSRLGNWSRMRTFRIVWLALSIAAGMPMAVSATCAIIAPVHTRPNRSVARPVPRLARWGCTRARVTRSAGSTDSITALTTASPPAYSTVERSRPGTIQNGAPPRPRLTLSIPHLNARSTASSPIAAETDASTSASTKS